MLRTIHIGVPLPISYPVHPSAEFEPGVFAQLTILGNDIMATISDGTAPLGLIDDSRTNSFSKPQIDEITEIRIDTRDIETDENGHLVNARDAVGYLDFPNIIEGSFTSDVNIILNLINGVITVPAGTELNYDSNGDGVNDSFKLISSYIYRIANKPGDDTTIGSNRITIYYQKGFYATDQYDTRQAYPLNQTLYVGLDGKLTSKQPTPSHPGIAFVTGPPTSVESTLEFFLL